MRKSELCRIRTDASPAQSQALQFFADGKSKKVCARFPSPKRSRSAPILRADLFLMQTLINPQIDSISLQHPGGHRREIKIISGFAGAVIASLSCSRKSFSSAQYSEAHTENHPAITICRKITKSQISKDKKPTFCSMKR